MGLSHDGRYAALPVSEPGPEIIPFVSIWDLTTGKPVIERLDLDYQIRATILMHYSPDDQMLLATGFNAMTPEGFAAAKTLYVFDAWDGALIHTFSFDDQFYSAIWSPDGSKIAGGTVTGKIVVWDFQTGEQIALMEHGNDRSMMVNDVKFSPDGSKLASASDDSTIRVWDTKQWKMLFEIAAHVPPAMVMTVNWSPDGAYLLTAAGNDRSGSKDMTARIWDAKTGKQVMVFYGHSSMVYEAEWSPNGKRVVTSSTDSTTRIWDAATGAEMLSISTPTNFILNAKWSADGKYVVTSGTGPGPTAWRVWQTTDELIAYAKACCVFRQLTPTERQQFGLTAIEATGAEELQPAAEGTLSTPTTSAPEATPGAALPALPIVSIGLMALMIVWRRR